MYDFKKYLRVIFREIDKSIIPLSLFFFASGLIKDSPEISAIMLLIAYILLAAKLNVIYAFDILSEKAYMFELFPIGETTKIFSKIVAGSLFQIIMYISFILGNGIIKLINGERGYMGTVLIEKIYSNGIMSGAVIFLSMIIAISAASQLFYKLSIMAQLISILGFLTSITPLYFILYYIVGYIKGRNMVAGASHPILISSICAIIVISSIICEIRFSESEDNNLL